MKKLPPDPGRRHPELPDAVAGTRPEKEGLTNEHERTVGGSPPDRAGKRTEAEGMEGKEEGGMKTKSGKSHFVATLVKVMPDGTVTRHDNYRFTAFDPEKFAEQLPKRFSGAKWIARFENLKNLDE